MSKQKINSTVKEIILFTTDKLNLNKEAKYFHSEIPQSTDERN